MSFTVVLKSEEGQKTLERLAAEQGLEGDKLEQLLAAVARHSGMLRRRGLFQQFDAILEEAGTE